MSMVLHTAIAVVLLFLFRFAPRGGPAEADRSVGIALVKKADGQREYVFSEKKSDTEQTSQSSSQNLATALPTTSELEIDLEGVLPSEDEALFGDGELSVSDAGDLSSDGDPGQQVLDGQTTTSVFGVSGTGSKFVYVFDRSGSMSGSPLQAAKMQLGKSLKDLDESHQFQIIFYNERPKIFQQKAKRPQLFWGSNANRDSAVRFIRGIEAAGATRHMDALRMALGMSPDVLFFLTDADEPQLTPAELDKIRSLNARTMINAIEFGAGPQRNRSNFLTRLANQNGGQHAYVDITLLAP